MLYAVLDPLSHNGKEYAVGEAVEIEELRQAQALQALKVIGDEVSPGSGSPAKSSKSKKEVDGSQNDSKTEDPKTEAP